MKIDDLQDLRMKIYTTQAVMCIGNGGSKSCPAKSAWDLAPRRASIKTDHHQQQRNNATPSLVEALQNM